MIYTRMVELNEDLARQKKYLLSSVEVRVSSTIVHKHRSENQLDYLEDYIHDLTRNWGRVCHDASDQVLGQPGSDVPPGSVCLAQFDDNEFYRALLLEENPEAKEKCVFFIDHGETMWISEKKVYECPVDLVDALPAQAIQCCLAPGQDESVLHLNSEEANLNNEGHICIIKVVGKEEHKKLVYVVEVYQRMPILLSDDKNKQGTLMENRGNDPSGGSEWAQESCDSMATQVDEISLTDAVNFLSGLVGLKNCSKGVSESYEKITEIDNEDLCVPTSLDRCISATEQLGDEASAWVSDCSIHAEKGLVTTPGSGQSLEKIPCNEDLCKATEMALELPQVQTNLEFSKKSKNESDIEGSLNVIQSKKTGDKAGNAAICELQDGKNYKDKIDKLKLEDLSDGELQENKELSSASLKSEKIGYEISDTGYSEVNQEIQTENRMEKSKDLHYAAEATSEIGQDLKKSTCNGKTKTDFKSEEVSRAIAVQREASLDWSVPSLQAVEKVTPKLKPMATWYQNISRVVLKLDLTSVSLYQCRFSSRHILFRTVLADRYYELNEHLYGRLNPDVSSVQIHPAHVLIIIVKQHQEMWKRLLHDKDKVAWLNVEWSMVEVGSSSEEEEQGDLAPFAGEAKPNHKGGRPAGVSDEDGSSSESCDSNDSDIYRHMS